MGKGYADGPAAEEAERRLEEAGAEPPPAPPVERAAVFGCTSDDPTPHHLGWAEDVDADDLFATGAAWGLVVRRVVDTETRRREEQLTGHR
jgi:hypothetical protein